MQGRTAIFVLALATFTTADASVVRNKRLIGGGPSPHRESSWMVSLQGDIPTRTFLGITISHDHVYCGGTLISDRWVLTAAHCFDRNKAMDPDNWHARMASPDLQSSLKEKFLGLLGKITNNADWMRMEFHPERIIRHPQYSAQNSWLNDIALIKLKESVPVASTDRVSTALLSPEEFTPVDGQVCTAYGWGCNRLGGRAAETTHKVALPIVSRTRCGLSWVGHDFETRICAGGSSAGRSSCQGDSGGPLMCETHDGKKVQVGIMSFIESRNPGDHPNVMTRVSYYRNWITSVMNNY